MRLRNLTRLPVLLSLLALSVLLALAAACGDDEEDKGDGGEGPGAIDISGVPELEDGVLDVGSDIAYAPMEFYIEGTETPDGVDIDLATAVAEALGVEVKFINTGFDGIIEALNTDEFDVIWSAMTVTDERKQQIDFVEYLNVGTGILVPAGNPKGIKSLEDLCGLTVAVQLGTIQEQMANEIECPAGKSVDVVTFDTNPLAVEDVRTGGADANLADYPVAALDAEQSDGDLEVLEINIDPAPYGIGVRKDSTQLKAVLEQALQAIKDSSKYDEILNKWGIPSLALD